MVIDRDKERRRRGKVTLQLAQFAWPISLPKHGLLSAQPSSDSATSSSIVGRGSNPAGHLITRPSPLDPGETHVLERCTSLFVRANVRPSLCVPKLLVQTDSLIWWPDHVWRQTDCACEARPRPKIHSSTRSRKDKAGCCPPSTVGPHILGPGPTTDLGPMHGRELQGRR